MFLLALAIAPIAFALIYIYNRDLIAKEPAGALAKSFFAGALLSVIGVLIVVFIWRAFFGDPELIENTLLASFDAAFIEAAIPEELFKFLVLFWLVWKSKDFDENFDGIVYAVYVSMGFACTENIMYVLMGGAGTGFARAFTAIPGHFCFGVLMGYYFSRAKFNRANRSSELFKALLFPILGHGIYDFMCFYTVFSLQRSDAENDTTYSILTVVILLFFFFNFKLWKQARKRINELRDLDAKQKSEKANALENEMDPFTQRSFSTYKRRDPRVQDLFDDFNN